MSRTGVENAIINGSTHMLKKAAENTGIDRGNVISRIQYDMSRFHSALPNGCEIIDGQVYRTGRYPMIVFSPTGSRWQQLTPERGSD